MPLWSKICCAIDFSEPSRAALKTAAGLARELDGSLVVLHVIPPVATYGPYAPPPVERSRRAYEQLAQWTGAASELAPGRAVSVELSGDIAEEVVRFAAEAECDVIVLGTHGRRGLRRLLWGSVAQTIVRAASRPVLVVHQEGTFVGTGIAESGRYAPPLGPEHSGLP